MSAYDAFLRDHPGLSKMPTRDRRIRAREDLANVEKIIERAERGRKHAATKSDAEAIDSKIERYEAEAVTLREDLGNTAYIGSPYGPQPDAPTCDLCHNEIGDAPSTYGVHDRCPLDIDQHQERIR